MPNFAHADGGSDTVIQNIIDTIFVNLLWCQKYNMFISQVIHIFNVQQDFMIMEESLYCIDTSCSQSVTLLNSFE